MGFCWVMQDVERWPLIDPLPSYGRGRELDGGRYVSLIHGDGIQDVIITGRWFYYYFWQILVVVFLFGW